MRRPLRVALAGLLAVVVLVGGGIALYLLVLRDDPPPRVELSEEAPGTTASTAAGGTADGEWRVRPGERTFVGYRVRETFADVPAPTDAVGRTPGVEGSMSLAGGTVASATVEADLTALESDEDRRDSALRGRGIETDRFPTATFELTEPIDLGGPPEQGVEVRATAVGELTLHGVTNPVEVPLEARWSGDAIEVVGSLDVVFADYDIEPPTVGGFVTVEDEGELELQLTFGRS